MCGLTGVLSHRDDIVRQDYYRAHSLLRHRGPDDEGFLVIGKDGSGQPCKGARTTPELSALLPDLRDSHQNASGILGHHRLSILDLGPDGHQPMQFDGLWLAYNGEVYNYPELRVELESKGYNFRSGSDTEVVLKALHCWGRAAFNRFNGISKS